MKIGLGLFRNMLTKENYRFAKQAGCTHIIAHLSDRSNVIDSQNDLLRGEKFVSDDRAVAKDSAWDYENLVALRQSINEEGLELYAIENFSPADWYDILLDGPSKMEQMAYLKQIIQNMGKAGIPVMGYNFSIAGVWGQVRERAARGGALTFSFKGGENEKETLIPNGQIWNMNYAPTNSNDVIASITVEKLWDRLAYFLKEMVPVAEAAGVILAAHPDDPPMKTLRGTPRLVYQPQLYQKLLEIIPSASNALEFCMGTIQEMSEGNVYDALEQYSSQGKIAYLHFRNVRGKVPNYTETFIDEGDIDVFRALRILKKNNYEGVLIPDHTPLMDCGAPWHSGMAYALGFMNAAIRMIEA
jgi:mannonate dehydratase